MSLSALMHLKLSLTVEMGLARPKGRARVKSPTWTQQSSKPWTLGDKTARSALLATLT